MLQLLKHRIIRPVMTCWFRLSRQGLLAWREIGLRLTLHDSMHSDPAYLNGIRLLANQTSVKLEETKLLP